MSDREEIAVKLREASAEFEDDDDFSFYDAGIKLYHITNTKFDVSPTQVFAKLADIIDPTCQIKFKDTSRNNPDTGYEPDGYYYCSNCKHELSNYDEEAWNDFKANDYEDEPPFEYCPHCDARIIINKAQQI